MIVFHEYEEYLRLASHCEENVSLVLRKQKQCPLMHIFKITSYYLKRENNTVEPRDVDFNFLSYDNASRMLSYGKRKFRLRMKIIVTGFQCVHLKLA